MKKLEFENMRLKKETKELIEEVKKYIPNFEIKKYKGRYVRVGSGNRLIMARFKNQKEICDYSLKLIRESEVEKIMLELRAETSIPLTTDMIYSGDSRDSIRVYYEKLTKEQFEKILDTLKTFTKEEIEKEVQKTFEVGGKMITLQAEKLTERYTHFTLEKATVKTNCTKATTTNNKKEGGAKVIRKFANVIDGNVKTEYSEVKAEVKKYITLCEEIYNRKFDKSIQVNINSRLSRALGYFKYCGKRPVSIDISEKLLRGYEDEFISDVVGHEVAHYIMHQLGNYSEKHGKKFKSLCAKLGVCGKATTSAAPFMTEEYKEYKRQQNIKKANSNSKSRYVVACPNEDCDITPKYFKVAKKDSITRWVNNYYCPKHGYCLVCYDTKEKLKYWAEPEDWAFDTPTVESDKMTKDEIEKYC